MRNAAIAKLGGPVGTWSLTMTNAWFLAGVAVADGVSRVFGMTWGDGAWTLLRENPDFHQRIVATVDGDRILASVDASEDQGATWRKDFDLPFERQAGA